MKMEMRKKEWERLIEATKNYDDDDEIKTMYVEKLDKNSSNNKKHF